MEYQDFVFFKLANGNFQKIPHQDYVALMHRDKTMAEYAGQTLRIALLYVAVQQDQPCRVENGTYSLLRFDETGYADAHFTGNSLEDNHAFYLAVEKSQFDNIDCDPNIQKLRTQLGQEFSWYPTEEELQAMSAMIMSEPPSSDPDKFRKEPQI